LQLLSQQMFANRTSPLSERTCYRLYRKIRAIPPLT
jgi:hypothetical protein